MKYVTMASQQLTMVGGLEMLHASRSLIVGNCDSSVHTDARVFAYPSSNIVDPPDQTSLSIMEPQPTRYHGAPVSNVFPTDLP
jgi:hypothetical protein